MRATLILVVLLVTSFYCKANEIDHLRTLDDVKSFIKKRLHPTKDFDSFFSGSKIDPGAQLSHRKFIKIDLNNDGLTDLILNGVYLMVVLDDGHGGYNLRYIDRGTFIMKQFALIGVDTLQAPPKLVIESFDSFEKQKTEPANFDTLVFKFNDFIAFSNKIDTIPIDEIALSTTMCFGTCPIFKMSVSRTGHATYNAIQYNKQEGKFECNVDSTSLTDLFGLTEYINARSLKSNYKVNWTDDQTANLSIKYHDGSVKEISDYGHVGTFGLARLYDIFYALRNSQQWEDVN